MQYNTIYTPILKWRQAEEKALKELSDEDKKRVTPLIQLVHKYKYFTDENNLRIRLETPQNEVLNWSLDKIRGFFGFSKIYLDSRPLYENSDNDEYLAALLRSASTLFDTNIVPVFSLQSLDKQLSQEIKEYFLNHGICIRIYKEDINAELSKKLVNFLEKIGLKKENIDILFDYQVTDENDLDDLVSFIKFDKESAGWRSICFASGAFRKDLMGLELGMNIHNRKDLVKWKSLLKEVALACNLGYGDYTIQYPIYSPPIMNSNPSRSIIYARDDDWIIMKGQSDNANGSEKAKQYFAEATLLVKGNLLKSESCCKGEQRIINLSRDSGRGMGSFSTWLQVGIHHHMVLTLRQLSNLS